MLTRRQFIRTGIAGGLALGLARLTYGPFTPDPLYDAGNRAQFRFLDGKSRTALAAIAAVMLAGALPKGKAEFDAALHAVVLGADGVIAGLPVPVREELKDLFALLNNAIARRWLVGVTSPWEQASEDRLTQFLNRWRYSSLLLMRSGYQALHQIIFASWYGNPKAWVGIAYEGPPEFMKNFWTN